MKATLKAGISHTRRVHVDKEKTIGMMGDDLRVYSTPDMVSDLEYTCRDLLMAHAESDEDSVGAHVRVDHLGPTLLGMWVDIIVKQNGQWIVVGIAELLRPRTYKTPDEFPAAS